MPIKRETLIRGQYTIVCLKIFMLHIFLNISTCIKTSGFERCSLNSKKKNSKTFPSKRPFFLSGIHTQLKVKTLRSFPIEKKDEST